MNAIADVQRREREAAAQKAANPPPPPPSRGAVDYKAHCEKLEDFIGENIIRKFVAEDYGIFAKRLLDALDSSMTQEETDAVWLLIHFAKKRQFEMAPPLPPNLRDAP